MVSLVPAPLLPAQVAFASTSIVVGSPAYSTASTAIQNDLQAPVHFNAENTQIILPGLPPVTNTRQAFIVRLRHDSHFVFYLGGLSDAGTAAAISYLARSWRALYRRYRHVPSFYVLIEFVGEDHTNSHIVAESQLNVA
ncbi:MAG: hypothetical protein DMF41_01590 [Verrucomicrobia bacterium]|nr:MAG: hypothetical protein DMF41_01590 [Verrucomicrobiota bacterium]